MSAKCRAFRHYWEGHVYEEVHPHTSIKVWVARLTCGDCGTRRVDYMTRKTCELISRNYFYPETYDTKMDILTAKQVLFKGMLTK